MDDRGHLLTEQTNQAAAALDTLATADAFDVMSSEDAKVAAAVAAAKPAIVAAVDGISSRLRAGGRLFYVGAGTSGRLGVLDAAECPPTFLTDPEMVQGIIAGGPAALTQAVEHAEDDPEGGALELRKRGLHPQDAVFGISTGGTTPFVHGALAAARQVGALTIFFACVPPDQVTDQADISIRVLTGPEVISGSTRLKAGIATKLTLNMVSTLVMVRLGKVYGNLMVDLNAAGCAKLTDRAVRITAIATGLPRAEAEALLSRAGWRVKTALVMHGTGLDQQASNARLAARGGSVRAALTDGPA